MSNSKYELECVEVMTTFVILIDQDVKELTEIAIAIEAPREVELEIQMYCGESPNLTLENIKKPVAFQLLDGERLQQTINVIESYVIICNKGQVPLHQWKF